MKKTIIITITILVITIIVLGYKLNTSNNLNVTLTTFIQAKKDTLDLISATENDYTACVKSAMQDYNDNWNSQCDLLGKGSECGLPTSDAQSLAQGRKESETTCLEVYKIRMATFK